LDCNAHKQIPNLARFRDGGWVENHVMAFLVLPVLSHGSLSPRNRVTARNIVGTLSSLEDQPDLPSTRGS
jgi:hypothetical protein